MIRWVRFSHTRDVNVTWSEKTISLPLPIPTVGLEFVPTDRDSGGTLHRQLYRWLRQRILAGELREGTRLPSTRALAKGLNLSRNTVISAFEQLASEGFIESKVGRGTIVARGLDHAPTTARPVPSASVKYLSDRGERLSRPLRNLPDSDEIPLFQPGLPEMSEFPRAAWSRLLSRRSRILSDGLCGYAHAGGFGPLRESLAAYLCAARGVHCSAREVLVVTTAQAALDLSARLLTDPDDQAWIECPGYIGARASFEANGLDVRTIPTDRNGVRVGSIPNLAPDARLGYVTASHHYPTGATLTLERRLVLLNWMRVAQSWLIEDDYDSEFRYVNAPIAAIQGLEPGARVIYVGSFSKTLFPGLRVAYLVAPQELVGAFRQALRQTGQEPSLPVQAALHDFIEQGLFSRHVRRMRAIYAARNRALTDALATHLHPFGEPLPADGGLQLSFMLRDGLDDDAIAKAAKAAGFGVEALSRYRGDQEGPGGLVFGVGTTGREPIEASVLRLKRHIRAVC